MGPRRAWQLMVLAFCAVLVLAGCRSTTANITVVPTTTTLALAGDAGNGAVLFVEVACTACHTLEGVSDGTTGPNLTTIAADVAARLADGSYTGSATDVVSYLRESIADPRAFVPPVCPAGPCLDGIMPNTFAEQLSAQELADLVAYLSAQS